MSDPLRSTKGNEYSLKFSQHHQRWAGYSRRPTDKAILEKNSLKARVQELEAENAGLRMTVNFYEETFLREE